MTPKTASEDIGIVGVVDMRRQSLEPLGGQDVVQMRGAMGMAAQLGKQLTNRTVIGNGIVFWPHSPEPVAAVGPRPEPPPQVEVGLKALLLNVIEPLVIGLPDIQLGPGDRRARQVAHRSPDLHRLALTMQADVRAHFHDRRIIDVKRA